MAAFWMLTNCKNGISSMEVHRALGITQKSAWFMLQRIRLALQDDFYGKKLGSGGSEIEVDESFIGGKARNMHLSERKRRITRTGTKDKTAVMAILERGGKIRATVAMSSVFGKRLTYSQLTGKDESPRHETTGAGEAPQVPF